MIRRPSTGLLALTAVLLLVPYPLNAIEGWDAYQAVHPDAVPCAEEVRRGFALMNQGDSLKALATFRVASEHGCGEDGLVLAATAFLYRLGGKDADARATYERALPLLERDYPRSQARVNALYNLGDLFQRGGAPDRAEALYRQALDLAPAFANARTSLKGLKLAQARAAMEAGDYERARQASESALELQQQLDAGLKKPHLKAQREALLLAVEAGARAGALDRAGELARELLTAADAQTAQQLGAVWERAGAPGERAEEAYRKAADLDPANPAPLVSLAALYENRGQSLRAAAAYEEAATRASDNADLWYAAGVARHESGDALKARAAFKKALAVDPGHAEARDALKQLGGAK